MPRTKGGGFDTEPESSLPARGVEVVTAARKKVIELEDRRLAALGGRRSDQRVALRDTLLGRRR
jgi:hypothetical protein